MHKFTQQAKLAASRMYVRLLSLTRAAHSLPTPDLKPKLVHVQNTKSFILLILILALLFTAYVHTIRAPSSFPLESLITLEEGKPLSTLAESLHTQSVIRNPNALSLLLRLQGNATHIHAGDYIFHKRQNIFTIARIITTGSFGLEPVTVIIPEGVTVRDIAWLYEQKMLRFNKEKFIKLALPLEGYLFPDTYFFLPNASEKEIVRVMQDNFNKKIAPLMPDIKKSGKTLEEIVTMASIVEKEARIHNDRKMIAGVLWHRIDINMPLQVDATFVYTHNKGSSQITMAELLDDTNAYNTYKHTGLPPGPIASPSLSAFKATIYPTENPYIFYLADKYGKTYFSKTYAEHLRKRAKYIDF